MVDFVTQRCRYRLGFTTLAVLSASTTMSDGQCWKTMVESVSCMTRASRSIGVRALCYDKAVHTADASTLGS